MVLFLFLFLKILIPFVVATFPLALGPQNTDPWSQDKVVVPVEQVWKYSVAPWGEPVNNVFGKLRQEFSAPATPWGPGHRGIDFYAPPGTDLRSPTAGTVTFVGTVGQRRLITVQDSTGRQATLEPACARVKQGVTVTRGQVIGSVCSGTTQYETHCNNCAHLGARVNGEYISPLILMGRFQASVLKAD